MIAFVLAIVGLFVVAELDMIVGRLDKLCESTTPEDGGKVR